MLNKFFSETFAVGQHGFYCRKTTTDSGRVFIAYDFKGKAASIGPAVARVTQIKDVIPFLTVKWLTKIRAEKRL